LNQPRHCPAVLIAAPASGQGKTTVTAALARLHRNLGRKVRVFKCGPDFLDPMIHERASGAPVYQLDMWMVGEQESRRLLWEAAGEADLILIEGVMGLFDGTPSSADLARHFGVPVLAVIDGTAMAQTFGALALGLARYQPDLPFAGVLANRVGTLRHAQLLEGSLTEGLRWYGALSRETGIELPSRHLGLVQASELNDLDVRLDAAAQALGNSCEVALPPPVTFAAPEVIEAEPLLAGVRIAVARDEAFAFTYGASLDLLRAMGPSCAFSHRFMIAKCPRPTASICQAGTRSCITRRWRKTPRCSMPSVPIMLPVNPCLPSVAACSTCWTRSPMSTAPVSGWSACCRGMR